MSPSSASSSSSAASLNNLVPLNGPNSNKSTGSSTSSSSSSSGASTKQNKKTRQTIAALAAAASQARTGPATPTQANQLAAFASQFGQGNYDQMMSETEKAKLLATHTPKPNTAASKHIKKQHLLSASVNNTPNNGINMPVNKPVKGAGKKAKAMGHFQDSSNLLLQAQPLNAQNPAAAAAAAAAAALQYHHHLLNNNLHKTMNNSTPHKPNPKFLMANGAYAEDENKNYEDGDGEEGENYEDDEMKEVQNGVVNGPLSIKSLTQPSPLTQSNINTPGLNQSQSNMEFACNACEKKFKYFCYYKRHMDACHSECPKYVCNTCNKSYKWEASFRQHLRSHHGASGQPGSDDMKNEAADMKNENEYGEEDHNNENIMEENNENRRMSEGGLNESGNEHSEEMQENGRHGEMEEEDDDDEDADIDSQEQDIEQQINQSQNEPRINYYERDNEQIGAAGTLASIAESLTGRLMINNHNI